MWNLVETVEETLPTAIPEPEKELPALPIISVKETPLLNDERLQQLIKPSDIKAEIDRWELKCNNLLHPSADSDKEIAMKIQRAIAVPVGALTQRSGTDLKTQISKIAALLTAHGNELIFNMHVIGCYTLKLKPEENREKKRSQTNNQLNLT